MEKSNILKKQKHLNIYKSLIYNSFISTSKVPNTGGTSNRPGAIENRHASARLIQIAMEKLETIQ